MKKENIIFYGYKEPLTKFKEGFGYRGVLSYSKLQELLRI